MGLILGSYHTSDFSFVILSFFLSPTQLFLVIVVLFSFLFFSIFFSSPFLHFVFLPAFPLCILSPPPFLFRSSVFLSVSQSASQPASQSASQPVSQPANQPTSRSLKPKHSPGPWQTCTQTETRPQFIFFLSFFLYSL